MPRLWASETYFSQLKGGERTGNVESAAPPRLGDSVVARPLAIRLPDSDNEPFLEIALSGGAQYAGTGNIKDYPAEARSGIEALAPRLFIELYQAH